MTYNNFARRKGSKDKTKRAAKRVGAAVGGAALLAGAYGLSKRPNLGALGKKVADKIKSGARDGAEIATAAGGAAKRIGKKQFDKAKTLAMIDAKVAKARVGQAYKGAKSQVDSAVNKVKKGTNYFINRGEKIVNAKKKAK